MKLLASFKQVSRDDIEIYLNFLVTKEPEGITG